MISCGTPPNQETRNAVYSVPQLLANAMTLIDSNVVLSGTVEHVCSHAGRRCFLVDSTNEESIKVEASGSIESFGKELLGREITVSGKLLEHKVLAAEINEWELEIKADSVDAEDGGEKCAAEMANIKDMRDWMKKHGKDYYAIYYVDGLSYELLEQ